MVIQRKGEKVQEFFVIGSTGIGGRLLVLLNLMSLGLFWTLAHR